MTGTTPLPASVGLLSQRHLRRFVKNPVSLLGAVVFPALFYLGFLAVFRRLMAGRGIDYATFLTPSIVVQAMFLCAMSSAFYVAADRTDGMLRRVRSMPVPRLAPVLARAAADAARALLSITVVCALGASFGFRFSGGVGPTFAFVVLALGFALAVASCFGLVAFRIDSPEAVSQVLSLPYLGLLFLSTAFVPIGDFPEWIQPFVRNQPVTQVAECLRALASTGTAVAGPLTTSALWVGAVLVIGTTALVRAYGRNR